MESRLREALEIAEKYAAMRKDEVEHMLSSIAREEGKGIHVPYMKSEYMDELAECENALARIREIKGEIAA